jgi:hypothetical protein
LDQRRLQVHARSDDARMCGCTPCPCVVAQASRSRCRRGCSTKCNACMCVRARAPLLTCSPASASGGRPGRCCPRTRSTPRPSSRGCSCFASCSRYVAAPGAVSARRVCSCLVHSFFRSTRTVCGGACGARECVCVLVLVRCHCSLTCCALSACCGLDLCKHILYLHLFFSASRCQSHVHDRKWSRGL